MAVRADPLKAPSDRDRSSRFGLIRVCEPSKLIMPVRSRSAALERSPRQSIRVVFDCDVTMLFENTNRPHSYCTAACIESILYERRPCAGMSDPRDQLLGTCPRRRRQGVTGPKASCELSTLLTFHPRSEMELSLLEQVRWQAIDRMPSCRAVPGRI